MIGPYLDADLDALCRESLCNHFDPVAVARARFKHVELYRVSWDDINTEDFVNKAALYGVRSLISGFTDQDALGHQPTSLTLAETDGTLSFAALTYHSTTGDYNHGARLRAVLDYAEDWRNRNGHDLYSAPRLIEMPSVKMIALWLAGPKNVFIPVSEFSTKTLDPIAVDDTYLDKVRARVKERQQEYQKGGVSFGGGRPLPPPGS